MVHQGIPEFVASATELRPCRCHHAAIAVQCGLRATGNRHSVHWPHTFERHLGPRMNRIGERSPIAPDARTGVRPATSVPSAAVAQARPDARSDGLDGDGAGYTFARLRSRDADEHAARLSEWDQTYEQLTPGPFEGFLVEALFGGIQLFRETTNQAVHQFGAGRAGAFMIGVPVAMQGEGYHDGRPICADSVMVLRDRQSLDFRAPTHLELVAVSMPIDALRRYSLEIDQCDLEQELRGVSVVTPPRQRVERFRAFLLMALESISANPQKLHHPAMRKALAHAVFRSVVDTLAASDGEPAFVPRPTRSHAIVSRAQEYMREHVEDALTVEDLCRELGVSRRTLQYSFREVLRLNPVGYLRAVRLNGARRALKAAGCGDTVQDIAARWGFWHLSHFACDYRRMFGELPSETMQRAVPA